MASIQHSGNHITVVGAGTISYENIFVESTTVFSLNSSGELVVAELGTDNVILHYRASGDHNLARSDNVFFMGKKGRLTFNTVTAATAFLNLR